MTIAEPRGAPAMPHPPSALPPHLRRALDRWAARGPLPPILARLVEQEPPLPFAVGTHEALAARLPEFTTREIADLLRMIGTSDSYHRAVMAPGSMRHDPDGNPVGAISDKDRAYAAAMLARNKAARAGEESRQRAGHGPGRASGRRGDGAIRAAAE
jgi:hypothetical protein